jgi:hypothetical protein
VPGSVPPVVMQALWQMPETIRAEGLPPQPRTCP